MTSHDVAVMFTNRRLAKLKVRELAHHISQMPSRLASELAEVFRERGVGGLDFLAALQTPKAMTEFLASIGCGQSELVRALFFAAQQTNSWPWARDDKNEPVSD